MSDGIKYGNLETVPLVPSVATPPTFSKKLVVKEHGLGVPVSLAEARRLLGDSKTLLPLTDDVRKHLAYLLDMASRIQTRTKSGQTTIAQLMQAAEEANGEEMYVNDFVNIVFKGFVRVRDTKRSYNGVKTYDGYITKQYCQSFARDWDPLGKVDPVDFVHALSMEATGHKNYVDSEDAMRQIFAFTRGIHPTPTTEEDGYPSTHTFRWQY